MRSKAEVQSPPLQPARIDVLIPIFNAERTLESALRSIQLQSFGDIRILLINDGSTDSSLSIMTSIAAIDRRVCILSKPNSGIVDALNLGLANCSAEFVARHDGDDIAYPDRFEKQLAYLISHPDCVAVSSFARHIDEDGVPSGSIAKFHPIERADRKMVPSREPYLLHPFLMARRLALEGVGGYRYAHHSEDTDLYWRLQQVGRLHVMEEVLGDYRYSAQSITSSSALNGRLSAINSQLAAVSAGRRDEGKTDLDFPKAASKEMELVGSAEGIYKVAIRNLNAEEAQFLKAAFSAKLLELTAYRPYELDLCDARFIGPALVGIEPNLPLFNRKQIQRQRAIAAARLLRKGRIRSAWALATWSIVPQTAWRFCAQIFARLLPMSLRRRIRAVRSKWVELEA